VSLSLEDDVDLARRPDEFGFDWVEGGWPGRRGRRGLILDGAAGQAGRD